MKDNCFAAHGSECGICTCTFCEMKGQNCSFFKTQEQFAKDLKLSHQKVLALPEPYRKYILEKYKVRPMAD